MSSPFALWQALSPLHRGVICMIATTLFFSSMDVVAKTLTQTYDPLMIVWARYAGHAVGAVAIIVLVAPHLLRTTQPGMQLIRSSFLFAATILFFWAFAVMPLAEAIAVAQVAPLLITGLAALILGEKVGIWRWSGVVVGLIGALVIIQPGTAAFSWAALLPFFGALFFALYSIATRFLGDRESSWTTFTYSAGVGALLATIAVPFVWEAPSWEHVPLLFLIGALGAGGHGMLVAAFLHAGASVLAPFLYFTIAWAALFGWLIFDETPDQWTVSGAVIIVSAGLFVHFRTQIRSRRDADRT